MSEYEEGISTKKKIIKVLKSIPYLNSLILLKNAFTFKNMGKDETPPREIKNANLSPHLAICGIILLQTFFLSLILFSYINVLPNNDWYNWVFRPFILLPSSLYGILFWFVTFGGADTVYNFFEGMKSKNRRQKGKMVTLFVILLGICLFYYGSLIGLLNMFVGSLVWEGLLFFFIAEALYGVDTEKKELYRSNRELLHDIFVFWKPRRVGVKSQADKIERHFGKAALCAAVHAIWVLIAGFLLPNMPFFEPWEMQRVTIPTLGYDILEIMFPQQPSIGKKVQYMSFVALIIGLSAYWWKPRRIGKMFRIFFCFMLASTIGMPGFFLLFGVGQEEEVSGGKVWSPTNIIIMLVQMVFLFLFSLNKIIDMTELHATSNQLEKSWFQFNFILKKKKHYLTMAFFLFLSSMSASFCFTIFSGELIAPDQDLHQWFGMGWVEFFEKFKYIGTNVVFTGAMIYMWVLYRLGINTRVLQIEKEPRWDLRNWTFKRIDVWTPAFTKNDPITLKEFKSKGEIEIETGSGK
ncbi:MAG: hypothetical protein ACFFCS_23035 [Candidatus Hodarchaeota archaeon]